MVKHSPNILASEEKKPPPPSSDHTRLLAPPEAKHQRDGGIRQASYGTWQCFVHPIAQIVNLENRFQRSSYL